MFSRPTVENRPVSSAHKCTVHTVQFYHYNNLDFHPQKDYGINDICMNEYWNTYNKIFSV